MNVILILIDSLNRSMLGAYGGRPDIAPNIDRFASRGQVFTSHYVGSLPCMPARREIFSGRQDFLWRPWGHLEPFDHPLPHRAQALGFRTMLITDHYHYWENGAKGYMESFQGLEMIRGHEIDNWRVDPANGRPEWVRATERYRPGFGERYFRNVQDFRGEEDFFSPRVFACADDWLQRNHGRGPYFLQLETFDVHEPFHVPEPYRSLFTENARENYNCWPPYQDAALREKFFDETSAEELDFIRGQYLGKLHMLDKWLGRVLDRLDSLHAWDDTMVVLTTDHGHDLGEGRAFGKQHPHYDSHANIPLIMWHPELAGRAGQQIDALTCTVDLHATLREAMGEPGPKAEHSQSLLPLLLGQTQTHRPWCLYGTFGAGACITDGRHVLMQGCLGDRPLNIYSCVMAGHAWHHGLKPSDIGCEAYLPGLDFPLWRIPVSGGETRPGGKTPVRGADYPSILVERGASRDAANNLYDRAPALRARMEDLLRRAMLEVGSPPEQFERLGL